MSPAFEKNKTIQIKIVEERLHTCYWNSDVLWKQKYHDLQCVRFIDFLHHGRLALCWLSVFTARFTFFDI